jgi:hypothetical protein
MSIVNDALKKIEAKQEAINVKPKVLQDKPEEKREIFRPKPIRKKQSKALYWLIAIIGGVLLIAVISVTLRTDKVLLRSNAIAKGNITGVANTKAGNLFRSIVRNKDFELTGIMYSEYEPAAIINNRVVKTGDVIEGATVASIQETLVKLSQQGKEIILQVE